MTIEYQLTNNKYQLLSEEKYTIENIDKYLTMDYNVNAQYVKFYNKYELISEFVSNNLEQLSLKNIIQYAMIKNDLGLFVELCNVHGPSEVKDKLYEYIVLLYIHDCAEIFKYCYYQLEMNAKILLNSDYIGYPYAHNVYKFIYNNINDRIGIMILSKLNEYYYGIEFIQFLVDEFGVTSNDIKKAKLKMNLTCLKYCYDNVGLNIDDIKEQNIINEFNSIEIFSWLIEIGYTINDFRYRNNYILHEVSGHDIKDVIFLHETIGLNCDDFSSRMNQFIYTALTMECIDIIEYLVKKVGVGRECFVDYMYDKIDSEREFNNVDNYLNNVFNF